MAKLLLFAALVAAVATSQAAAIRSENKKSVSNYENAGRVRVVREFTQEVFSGVSCATSSLCYASTAEGVFSFDGSVFNSSLVLVLQPPNIPPLQVEFFGSKAQVGGVALAAVRAKDNTTKLSALYPSTVGALGVANIPSGVDMTLGSAFGSFASPDGQRAFVKNGDTTLISFDGGANFNLANFTANLRASGFKLSLNGFRSIAMPSDRCVFIEAFTISAPSYRKLVKSLDGGSTWTSANTYYDGDALSGVSCVDEDVCYVFDNPFAPTVFKTTTGGAGLWEVIWSGDRDAGQSVNHLKTNGAGTVAFLQSSGPYESLTQTLYVSSDAGKTFTAVSTPDIGYNVPIAGVDVTESGDVFYYGKSLSLGTFIVFAYKQ